MLTALLALVQTDLIWTSLAPVADLIWTVPGKADLIWTTLKADLIWTAFM